MVQKNTISYGVHIALIGACASLLFFAIPQTSSAHHMESADDTASSTSNDSHYMMPKKMKVKNVDATCMQAGVDARETALATSWTTFTTSVMDGLSKRKTALNTAWGLSDVKERGAAVVTAWKDWRTAQQVAHKKLKESRKSAWDTFKKTSKDSCKMNVPKDENLGKEEAGAVTL